MPLLEREPRVLVIANRTQERADASAAAVFQFWKYPRPSITTDLTASNSISSLTPPPPASMANFLRFLPAFLPGNRSRMT